MTRRLLLGLIGALGLSAAVVPSQAVAIPARLVGVASRSVFAADSDGVAYTAFGFSGGAIVLSGSATSSPIRVTTTSGAEATGGVIRRQGDVVMINISGISESPLKASGVREVRPSTPAYVIGSPLGFGLERIRYVRLPTVWLDQTQLVTVPGSLPRVFLGAPIVTAGARVIGAVAVVGAHQWKLAPRALLVKLVAAPARGGSGGGVPILSLLAGALIVFAAGAAVGVIRARSRRQREREQAEARRRRAAGRGSRPSAEPIVRLRTPQDEAADDFDVVVKSKEDS